MGNRDITVIGPKTTLPKAFRRRRVALYARVSTDRTEQENSLAAQIDYFEKRIALNPNWVPAGVFYDDGISGLGYRDRPGFDTTLFYDYSTWRFIIRQITVDNPRSPNALGHNYVDVVCSRCGEKELVTSGRCGDNLTWKLEADGMLTISGTGEMYDGNSRWGDHADKIKSVVIDNGVTSIGNEAFYSCDNLSCFKCVAAAAVAGFDALLGTGRCGGYRPLAVIVTEGIYIAIFVDVAANTSVRGVALFGASRCGNNIRKAVYYICCGDVVKREAVSAVTAVRHKTDCQCITVYLTFIIFNLLILFISLNITDIY